MEDLMRQLREDFDEYIVGVYPSDKTDEELLVAFAGDGIYTDTYEVHCE